MAARSTPNNSHLASVQGVNDLGEVMSKDDTAVNDQVVADTTAAESAPVENESLEVVRDGEALNPNDFREETDGKDEPEADDTAEPVEADETKEPQESDKTQSPEDEWNSLTGNSQDRFRQAINERNELRQRMAELEARKAQFATEQDLLNEVNPETGDYYTPQEAERVSWQQSRQAQAERTNQELYQLQVQQNQVAIDDEVKEVTQEFGLLNPKSEEFKPEQFNDFMELLEDSLVYALPNGQQYNRSTLLQHGINPETQATLVGYSTSPKKLAKSIANSYTSAKVKGETIGQANAQRATEKMLAHVDAPSGNRPSNPSKESEAGMSADEYAKAHGLKVTWQ